MLRLLNNVSILCRNPSVTIKTNTYHFCKLSLVKKPSAHAPQAEGHCYHDETEFRGAFDLESLDGSKEKAERGLTESSNVVGGLLKLTDFFFI